MTSARVVSDAPSYAAGEAHWITQTTGGALRVEMLSTGKAIKSVSGTLTTDTDLVAAVTGKRIKVIAYALTTTGQSINAAIFKSGGTTGTEIWRLLLEAPANTVFHEALSIAAPSFLFATVAGEKLTLDVGNTDTIHYAITYFDNDAT